MAKKIIEARMKQRIDTKANWAANNPVLLEGELGIVSDDKNLYKVGDGVTAWNDRPFRGFDGTLVHETGESENAAMSQKGVTESLTELAKEIEKELLGVDDKTNSNYSEIVKLGAKLSVFRGGAMYIYSEKTEDGLYKVGEISHMYYNDKLYHLPTAIGEKLEIDNMPFSLVIERVEKPYVKITGFGLNNLNIRPIYFGNPVTIPTELMPTDSELNEESEKLLPNSIIAKEINAVHSEIETLQTEKESQSELIEDLYNTKIDKQADDYYPQLSVGVADNLAGHEDATPSEIGFRRSGGGAILDGNARIESIKGNSVVWNNKINKGTPSFSYSAAGLVATYSEGYWSYTITAKLTGIALLPSQAWGKGIGGHKMIMLQEGTHNLGLLKCVVYGANAQQGFDMNTVFTCPFDSTDIEPVAQLLTIGNEYTARLRYSLIDLTKMFGAGNEPTTIDEFYARKPLGIDEYAYNEGEVIHNATDKIESMGVNQWDEEWEVGDISADTGLNIEGTSRWRTKGYIEVLPNAKYYVYAGGLSASMRTRFYTDDYSMIGTNDADNAEGKTGREIKIPANARYIRFSPNISDIPIDTPFCINLSDPSINGKYFPYVKREQNLDIIGKYFPDGMKSAGRGEGQYRPDNSTHDEIRYNKVTQKWEKVVRFGAVDMGDLTWVYENKEEEAMFCTNADPRFPKKNFAIICGKYYVRYEVPINIRDKEISSVPYYGYQRLMVRDSSYGTDAAAFKAAMQGVMLYYELAEPIVTEIEETINLDYPVWNVGTENAVANVPSTPLKADIIYGFNAYGVIKELLARVASLEAANASLASQLASVTSHNEEV